MKQFFVAAVAASTLLAFGAQSQATVLVDTGTPTINSGGFSLYNLGGSEFQWLANNFTVGAADTITDVYGFIGGTAGTFTIALYDNNGNIPGTELYSAQATSDGDEGFEGLSGLNWGVAAANYWVAFEVRTGDTLNGYMSFTDVPNPLPGGAFSNGDFTMGYVPSDIGTGVRVYGNGIAGGAVPEPATWAMMIIGFGAAGSMIRRRKAVLA